MKLGVDVRCLQDTFRTGVGEYAWQVLKYLALNKECELFGFANAAKKIDLPDEVTKVARISQGRVPNKIMNLMQWQGWGKPLDKILIHQHGNVDAVWLPNPNFVSLSGEIPSILTVHDLAFMHHPEYFPSKGKYWYFPAVKKILNSGFAGNYFIVAVSQHTADDLVALFPKHSNKICIAPPGLDQKYFDKVTEENILKMRQKYSLPEKYLLSLGTIEPRKNYALLIKAYEQALLNRQDYDYDLVIAGNWGWKYEPIKKMLRASKFASRIRFINYVDQQDKPALYQGASLFLFPSLYEGIGLPVLEAMASGLPVISSNTSSMPEIVNKAGLLLSPHLPDLWTYEILEFASNPNGFDKFLELGKQQAQQYNWKKTADVYSSYFRKLIYS